MAGKRAKPVRGERARRVVQAALAGRTTRQIAADEGIGARTVTNVMRREAALIARLTEQHEADLVAAYAGAVAGLRRDVRSKSAATRHDARQVLLKYITAADRLRVTEASAGSVTLAEVLIVYGRLMRGEDVAA